MDASVGLTVATLAAACVAAWLALRALSRRDGGASGMRVVGRLALEPRRSLVMVEAAGRVFLVGSSEGGLTLLTELAAHESADAWQEAGNAARGPAGIGLQNASDRQTDAVYAKKQSRLNVFGEAWKRVMRGGA